MAFKHEIFIRYKWGGPRKEWVDKIFAPLLEEALTNDYRSEVREPYNVKSSIKEVEYALRSSKYKSDPQIRETVMRLNRIEASLEAMTYK